MAKGHKKVVPKKTPPFVIIKITNGLESKTFVHLQNGVKKEVYGNVLDEYEIKEYCDSINFKKQKWKLGNPSVCKWRPKSLKQTLPTSVQTIPLNKKSKQTYEIFKGIYIMNPFEYF